jgi:hypothetical protein
VFPKICCNKRLTIRGKVLFLLCENKNYSLLPRLPKRKDKEKWQQKSQRQRLFMQKLRTTVYWRPRIELYKVAILNSIIKSNPNKVIMRVWWSMDFGLMSATRRIKCG